MKALTLSKSGAVFIGFLGIAGYFLWIEHNEHIVAYLPLLLVVGCVLMHVFMHKGHGTRGPEGDDDSHVHQRPGERHD